MSVLHALSCVFFFFLATFSVVDAGTAQVTYYNSYPQCCSGPAYSSSAPKDECLYYSGCDYQGLFAWFNDQKSYSWVKSHNIVALYDDSNPSGSNWRSNYGGKLITITKNGVTFKAIIADTCGNSDCNNCCHSNSKGGVLVDIEYNTLMNNFGTTSAADGTLSFTIGDLATSDTQYAFSGSAPPPPSSPVPSPTASSHPSSLTHTVFDNSLRNNWDYNYGWNADDLDYDTVLSDGHSNVIRWSANAANAALGFLRTSGSVNWQTKGYTVLKFNMKLADSSVSTSNKMRLSFRTPSNTQSWTDFANANPGCVKPLSLYSDWKSYTVSLANELGLSSSRFPNLDNSVKMIFQWDGTGPSPDIFIDDIRFSA